MITINFIYFIRNDKLPARLIIQAGIDVFVREEYSRVIIDSWKHSANAGVPPFIRKPTSTIRESRCLVS